MAEPYATREEMYALALNEGAFAGVDEEAQDTALDSASRTADSYLLKRFTLPLTSWGLDMKEAVANIAAYRIMSVRGFAPEASDAEQLRGRYTDAIAWLKGIATGSITPFDLVDASGGESSTDTGGEQRSRAYVLAPVAGSEASSEGEFWNRDGTTPGGIGPPKRRGW